MFLLAWWVAPVLGARLNAPPATIYWLAVLTGAVWLGVLSLGIIRREEGNLRWATLKQRLWLGTTAASEVGDKPRPSLGRLLPSLLLMGASVLCGTLVSMAVTVLSLMRPLSTLWPPYSGLLPWPSYAHTVELASPEHAGQWWWTALVFLAWVIGAVLGEELFFRGVLLPRMRAKSDRRARLANALLYAAYSLFRPWMIPFRFLEGLALAGPARRFRNNWLALAVRSVEGIGLLALLLVCGSMFSLPPLKGPLALPRLAPDPGPTPWGGMRGRLERLPVYDPNSEKMWQVDLRSRDLSALDLRASGPDLAFADYDSQTSWPAPARMPEGFDPKRILELGKNPGLSLRRLHAQGVTGRGVGIAIIDRPLQTTHREYAGRLRWYEKIGGPSGAAQMHGAAVASLAVGKTVGVAPEADLYYLAEPDAPQAFAVHFHLLAQGVRRILEINRLLPPERRIRVISLSVGWRPHSPGYDDIRAAAEAAKRAGLLVVCSSVEAVHGFHFQALGRAPLADPDDFASYEPGSFWRRYFWASAPSPPRRLHVPMDSRTTASPTGADDYVFYREGGWSWAIPYLAGLYALAVQVDPQMTPERFWSLALETGREIEVEHEGRRRMLGPIADPVALIAAVRGQIRPPQSP